MPKELVTMSASEIDRGDLIRRVLEKRLTQAKAAEALGLTARQVKRLCRAFKRDGLAGLAFQEARSPKQPPADGRLLELDDVRGGRETLRNWLSTPASGYRVFSGFRKHTSRATGASASASWS